MSKRERILAIAVASIIGLVVLQWGFNKVTSVLDEKNSALDEAIADSQRMDEIVSRGNRAAAKLKKLVKLSLPSRTENATSQYRDWLFELGRSVGMEDIDVTQPETTASTNPAYDTYNFVLQGNVALEKVLELMGNFYDKNYLHSIRDFKMLMLDDGNVTVTLSAQAIALKAASAGQTPPDEPSGRLAMPMDEYKSKILNRNPFAPPNVAPSISNKAVDVYVGGSLNHVLESEDPEGHDIDYKLVSTDSDLPEGLSLEDDTLTWKPTSPGKYELMVEVSDYGFPSAAREEKIVINVKEPEKPPVVEEPKFDITTQAFVSGLTSGRDGKKIWIRSRIDGKSLTLGEGEEFELGRLKAKVIEINLKEDFAELETDGMRWIADMNLSLAEAYKRSTEID